MRAARWDTAWEPDGLWRVVLRWRLGATPDAPLAELGDAQMQLWPTASGPPAEPAIVVPGELSIDARQVTFSRTSAETRQAAVGVTQYRHRVVVRDPAREDDRVLLRGFVTVVPPEAAP